jgi:hypothetical protein
MPRPSSTQDTHPVIIWINTTRISTMHSGETSTLTESSLVGASRCQSIRRRSSSMPMVNMEYFTNANTNVTHNTNSDVCDQLSAGYDGAASNHLAEGDDMVRDGVIYSRRMSMPAAMPTPTMVPSQYSGVTVSRRSMSMPMINTHEQQRLQQQQQHDDGMGGAMDMNMEDEFDDLLSQLRGSG